MTTKLTFYKDGMQDFSQILSRSTSQDDQKPRNNRPLTISTQPRVEPLLNYQSDQYSLLIDQWPLLAKELIHSDTNRPSNNDSDVRQKVQRSLPGHQHYIITILGPLRKKQISGQGKIQRFFGYSYTH